jgi:hypothetical protein
LSLVGEVASAVENVSAAYSDTTVAPHDFDQTKYVSTVPGSRVTFCDFEYLHHLTAAGDRLFWCIQDGSGFVSSPDAVYRWAALPGDRSSTPGLGGASES